MLANVNVVTKSGLKNLSDITNSDLIKCIDTNDLSMTYASDTCSVINNRLTLWLKLTFSNDEFLYCSHRQEFLLERGIFKSALALIGERLMLIPSNDNSVEENFCDSLIVKRIELAKMQSSWILNTPYSNFVIKIGDYEIVAHY